jgi:hypothetical protein
MEPDIVPVDLHSGNPCFSQLNFHS